MSHIPLQPLPPWQYLENNESDPVAEFQLVLDMLQFRLESASSSSGSSEEEEAATLINSPAQMQGRDKDVHVCGGGR